jgi:hypothetical protein
VEPVPDQLLLRKSGSAGNRTRTSGSVTDLDQFRPVSTRQDLQGSSVTSGVARADCLTSVSKVVHQLISGIICVVVVIEPTKIHAYIHHTATPHT